MSIEQFTDLVALIALVGSVHAVVMGVVLWFLPSGYRAANRVLGTLLLSIAVWLSMSLLVFHPIRPPYVVYGLKYAVYLFGPLLYLYARALTDPNSRFEARCALHFLPVLLSLLIHLFGLPFSREDYGHDTTYYLLAPSLLRKNSLYEALQSVSLIAYGLVIARRVVAHQRTIQQVFSDTEMISLRWLLWLAQLIGVMGVAGILVDLLQSALGAALAPWKATYVIVSVVVIYYISIKGILQPTIFRPGRSDVPQPADAAAGPEPASAPVEKYRKSGLEPAAVERLWDRLQRCMVEQRPHRREGIRLAELAEMLHVRPNYLSQVINSRAGANFYEFINRQRIIDAKALLLDPDQPLPLAEIGERCGFSSQSAFNNQFKKQVGTSPGVWREQQLAAITTAF